MRRVNWTVTEAQHQALKRLSQQTGLSISELVRRALDSYLKVLQSEGDAGLTPIIPKEDHHER